jgi:hypothetical protein
METWCEHWNIKFNEDKIWGIYFSRSRRPVSLASYWMDEIFHL